MDLRAASSNSIPKLLLGAGSDAPTGPTISLQTRSLGDL